jgi:hypothetical protein
VDDLELTRVRATTSGGEPVVRLRGTRGALLQGFRPGQAETFVRIEGERSAEIAVAGNDLRGVRRPVVASDGFAGRIVETGNLAPSP